MMQSTTATPCQFTIPRQPTVKYVVFRHYVGISMCNDVSERIGEYPTNEEAEKVIQNIVASGVPSRTMYFQIEKRYYP